MKVWRVYDDEIEELAQEVGLRILHPGVRRDGAGYRFRLALSERRPDGALKFQKIGYGGRRSAAVCWHGHREFMFALFRRFPEARLQTALADYRGRRHFLETYRQTRGRGTWNISGNQNCVCNPQPVAPYPFTEAARRWSQLIRQGMRSYEQTIRGY